MDLAWWRLHYDDTLNFSGEKLTIAKGARGAAVVDVPYTGNSGAGAIALASYYGADRIILIGYDCQYAQDGKRHWHGDHPKSIGNAVSMPKWPAQFESVSKMVSGVEVVNCSRETALKFWPRMDLEAALNESSRR